MRMIKRIARILNPLKAAIEEGMHVGNNVTLSSKWGSSFGSEPYLITIEDDVRMSGGVHFVTHDGGTWAFRDIKKYKVDGEDIGAYGSISVGYRSFIGYGVIIMPGVHIGKRCVIGAGAIVTKDIPDDSVAVGCPAKVIGNTFDYANKMLERHNQIGYDVKRLKLEKRGYLEELNRLGKI